MSQDLGVQSDVLFHHARPRTVTRMRNLIDNQIRLHPITSLVVSYPLIATPQSLEVGYDVGSEMPSSPGNES